MSRRNRLRKERSKITKDIETPKNTIINEDKSMFTDGLVQDNEHDFDENKPVKPEQFKINSELDPSNPEDLEAINEEARKWEEQVKKPLQAEEEVEKAEEFKKIIETESDLLKEFDEEEMIIQVVRQEKLYKFKVRPIEPGDVFTDLNLDADIYSNLSREDRKIVQKANRGALLNDQEIKVIDRINANNPEEKTNEALAIANYILPRHLTPPIFKDIKDRKKNLQARIDWWYTKPMTFKLYLAGEVMERLGLNANEQFKLFRPRR